MSILDLRLGDIIENVFEEPIKVSHITLTEYGIYVEGCFIFDSESAAGFILPEMPPPAEQVIPWYNFAGLGWVLYEGRKYAFVGLKRQGLRINPVETYIAAMKQLRESAFSHVLDSPAGQ